MLRVLIVEDSASDAELIKYEFEKNEVRYQDLIVISEEDYLAALHEFLPDIILSDYTLPLFSGLEALILGKKFAPLTPFILVTGTLNETIAVEIMKSGADDYILKGQLSRLVPAMKAAIEKCSLKKQNKLAENRLRILSRAVDQNPASIVITDVNGNIEYINDKFTVLTGYTLNEVKGKNPKILKSGKMSPAGYKILWDTITSGGEWHGEFENIKKNGETYFESAAISAITDESGSITHFLAVKEDITERKIAERKIRTLFMALEQSPVSVMITDADGNIEYVNQKFTSNLQYAFDEVLGRKPRIFNQGHLSRESYSEMWNALKNGHSWQTEYRNRRKNGAFFWENVIISPLMESGKLSNYILVSEDISERKKMVDELVSAKEKAEESDRLKTAFLQNISHEIRTPLNAIIGFSSLLADYDLTDEKKKEFLNMVLVSNDQLLSIITGIISISMLESGQDRISEEQTNINELLINVYRQFTAGRTDTGVTISYHSSLPEEHATIMTDSTKLMQILVNLIDNALKFTQTGTVKFGYATEAGYLKFFVEDTGIGIPESKQKIIFDRFQQVDSSPTRKYGGLGLGLPLSKGYVELLGGSIELNSEEGKGSVFRFTIPYKPVL